MVYLYSTIKMMHGPINIRFTTEHYFSLYASIISPTHTSLFSKQLVLGATSFCTPSQQMFLVGWQFAHFPVTVRRKDVYRHSVDKMLKPAEREEIKLRNVSKINFPGAKHAEMCGWFVEMKRLQSCIREGEFCDRPRNCQVQPTSAEAKKASFHCKLMAIYWTQIIEQNKKEKRKSMGTFRTAFSPTPIIWPN